MDKEINKEIKNKTKHFKKTKKFDNIYQTIDTYIDNLILRKQNIDQHIHLLTITSFIYNRSLLILIYYRY